MIEVERTVALFGQKQLKVIEITFESSPVFSCVAQVPKLFDWILDFVFLGSEVAQSVGGDENTCVLGFAHNCVQLWNSKSNEVSRKVNCEQPSLVYGQIYQISNNRFKVTPCRFLSEKTEF